MSQQVSIYQKLDCIGQVAIVSLEVKPLAIDAVVRCRSLTLGDRKSKFNSSKYAKAR